MNKTHPFASLSPAVAVLVLACYLAANPTHALVMAIVAGAFAVLLAVLMAIRS